MDELVIRRVSYGLELVDQLTQRPLIGPSRVSFELTGSWSGPEPVLYRVNRSRWVFEEDLSSTSSFSVVFTIEADFYQTQIITVLDANLDGTIQRRDMVPVVGYPFPAALTRVVGFARHGASGMPVPGAAVTFTQQFVIAGSDPPVFIGGPALDYTTFTDESGQYIAWFTPEVLSDPNARPTAARFDATATGTVNLGTGPVGVTGSITNQDLIAEKLNEAEIINMS